MCKMFKMNTLCVASSKQGWEWETRSASVELCPFLLPFSLLLPFLYLLCLGPLHKIQLEGLVSTVSFLAGLVRAWLTDS